jgi:hypothetical protein
MRSGWVAPGLGKRFVAVRASGESSAAQVERKPRKDFAKLIAEQIAFEIKRVGSGAQALVAGQCDAAFGARPAKQHVAAKLRIEEHVSAEQPKPSREPREHPVGGEFWRRSRIQFEQFVHSATI